jgi:hypothetical protein
MKDKLTQISDDLNHEVITEKEAKEQLLTLCSVVSSKIKVLLTYKEKIDLIMGGWRTDIKTTIIEVDDLLELNKLGDRLVDIKIVS